MVNHLWHFRVSALGFLFEAHIWNLFLGYWSLNYLWHVFPWESVAQTVGIWDAGAMQWAVFSKCLSSSDIFNVPLTYTVLFFCFVLGTARKLYFKSEHLIHICQFCWKFLKLFVTYDHRNVFIYVSVSSICVCMCVRDQL